jgi:hypothetical protein
MTSCESACIECCCIVRWSRSSSCRLLKQYNVHFLPIYPISERALFFEGYQASIAWPGSSVKMKLSVEHWWHGAVGGRAKHCNKNIPLPRLAPQMSCILA